MKRTDLYKYIREQIISELTETTYAGKGSVEKIKKDPKFNTLDAGAKTNVINDLTTGSDVELEEMARPADFYKKDDNTKFKEALDLYSSDTVEHIILLLIEKAGEEGISKPDIENKLKETGTVKNTDIAMVSSILTDFKKNNILNKPNAKISSLEEPEEADYSFLDDEESKEPESKKSEPEEEPETSPEEKEKEMDTAAVSAAFAGADQDIMPTTNKDVETLNKIKDVLTKKKNKIVKADEDGDDATYEKEMTALKQFVNNNKKIISKNEDIKNIISNIIDVK
jgi:hypothetical protein